VLVAEPRDRRDLGGAVRERDKVWQRADAQRIGGIAF
jgi:hypothetical protein